MRMLNPLPKSDIQDKRGLSSTWPWTRPRSKRRFNAFFVFAQINAPDFRARANNAGTGPTRKRIGLTGLRSLTLSCPEVAEQTAIATILSDMDTELAALESRLAKARQIKQGMMQELLTGRIRLL